MYSCVAVIVDRAVRHLPEPPKLDYALIDDRCIIAPFIKGGRRPEEFAKGVWRNYCLESNSLSESVDANR